MDGEDGDDPRGESSGRLSRAVEQDCALRPGRSHPGRQRCHQVAAWRRRGAAPAQGQHSGESDREVARRSPRPGLNLASANPQEARLASRTRPDQNPRAVFLLATLKHKRGGGEFSHTDVLAELVAERLGDNAVRSEIVRLSDFNIPAGTKSNMGRGDDWPEILQKILGAEIVVFATPIWWGNQSSLMQRAIERLDELHNELLETGKSRLDNKVGGIVITGEEDGEQHITGNIANFFLNIGLTVPPHCSVSYQG